MSVKENFEKLGWVVIDEYGSMAWEPRIKKKQTESEIPFGEKQVKNEIPFWEKYTLTIEEAAQLFRIGENKLRSIINEDPRRSFILWNGNRAQIKRRLFEQFIDGTDAI